MKWIKCSDKLPTCGESVLLKAKCLKDDDPKDTLIFVGNRGNYSEYDYCSAWGDGWTPFEFDDITHWMPLPKPPKE